MLTLHFKCTVQSYHAMHNCHYSRADPQWSSEPVVCQCLSQNASDLHVHILAHNRTYDPGHEDRCRKFFAGLFHTIRATAPGYASSSALPRSQRRRVTRFFNVRFGHRLRQEGLHLRGFHPRASQRPVRRSRLGLNVAQAPPSRWSPPCHARMGSVYLGWQ